MTVALDFTRLMDTARITLPGSIDRAIQLELFSVVDEFFRDSGVWREEIPVVTVVGQTIYDVESEEWTSAKVLRMVSLKNDAGTAMSGTLASAGKTAELVLPNEPTQVDTLTATVVLTIADPTDNDNYPRFPRWLLEKYRASFEAGVLGRMFSQPLKPYSSERLAIYHLRRFQGAISQARVDVSRAHLHGAQAWRYPGGWR